MLLAFALGCVLGYVGSIPAAGPLAILIANAALDGRRRRALSLAVGGAIAEGAWAVVAASGFGWVLSAQPALERVLRLAGGGLALALGVALLAARQGRRAGEVPAERASALAVGFLLVALNPAFLATWLAFCALLAAHPSLSAAASPRHALALGVGAALGVFGWFSTLGALVSRYRDSAVAWQRWLTRLVAVVLCVAGLAGLWRGAFG